MMPTSNAICALTGAPRISVWEACKEDDQQLSQAFEMKEFLLAERIIVMKIMTTFIFTNYKEAEEIICQYHEFFNIHSAKGPMNITYRIFFSGLVAFNALRGSSSHKTNWMDIGLNAIENMEAWTKECAWNFQNKLQLLRAEYLYSIGDFDRAAVEYQLSITSARDHRFIHEEAFAYERAGLFHLKLGRKELSDSLLKQACECYQSWGAETKASALLLSLQHKML